MAGMVWNALKDRNRDLGPAAHDGEWRNWRLTRDQAGVAWLLLDKADSSANALSAEVLSELDQILAGLEQQRPKGLVVRSAKSSGFIAGADITEFRGITDPMEVERRLTEAHRVVDRLEALSVPTVAVIHGFCLGGGLELALACDRRVALSDARFGFPEVMLGLHPGLGGTYRAMRTASPASAMELMLTGRTLDARRAKAAGLVDIVTEERHVHAAVGAAIDGSLRGAEQKPLGRMMATGLGRKILARRMRSEAGKKAPVEHYPAPYALIDLWERYGADEKAMQREEIRSFSRLLVSSAAQNLIRVFFLRETMKKIAGKSQNVGHVHVIGAGAMGGDIAAWCAWSGIRVTLADQQRPPLGAAIRRAATLYGKIGRKSARTRDALDRLVPDLKADGVRHADIVIEAVPENLDLKHCVLSATEAVMKPGAILATNTSSIPLEQLRDGIKSPERLIGLHFFNPVSRMQLVEIVHHDQVAPDVVEAANAFVGQIDRLPAPVKSAPGFLVNRALTPYLLEAMVLVDEGVRKEEIDEAAVRFGMPMGPIELADTVGLDICLHVADVLKQGLDWPMPDAPQWLRDKVAKGELGKKTGRGFYEWQKDEPQKAGKVMDVTEGLADRLVLPMLNVCVACLREGVVESEEIVDGAMIFGTGFAPFRGGPLHYARERGVDDVVATLRRLEGRHGERFRPDEGWSALA